jgi:hypothetical protein
MACDAADGPAGGISATRATGMNRTTALIWPPPGVIGEEQRVHECIVATLRDRLTHTNVAEPSVGLLSGMVWGSTYLPTPVLVGSGNLAGGRA